MQPIHVFSNVCNVDVDAGPPRSSAPALPARVLSHDAGVHLQQDRDVRSLEGATGVRKFAGIDGIQDRMA